MREKILAYCIRYEGDWQKIALALAKEVEILPASVDCHYVTIVDEEYPEKLKSLRFPPWILFYQGDLSLCEKPSIGIVGSREITEYGAWCTQRICETVKKQRVVVSGLARGIDACAHRFSLDGHTIGVSGCGLNTVYPISNQDLYTAMKDRHLILSEYPPNTPVRKHHFPWRNRIIAALSDYLVIPQAKIRSGTLVTANHAAELGKDIYCVPHRMNDPFGEGCNELISNGAILLRDFHELP